MTIKDILVHVDPGPAAIARLETVLALGGHFGAHVTVLHLIAEPYLRQLATGMAGRHMPDDLIRAYEEQAEAEMAPVLAAARSAAERHRVTLLARRETGPLDRLPTLLAHHGRHADLVVVGRPDPESGGVDDTLLAEAAFMDTGRPALVLPHGWSGVLPPRHALIAWDGSREAARAVHDALPLLRQARETTLLVVDRRDISIRPGEQPGAEIAAHLARSEVRVSVRTVESRGAGIGEVILREAGPADLIVMGGYGHSRLREMLLGGTTRHMLERTTLPILFAH